MTEALDQLNAFVSAQDDLKIFLQEHSDLFTTLKNKRKHVASLKQNLVNSMMENQLDTVGSPSGTIIRLEEKKQVKHDLETLKRIAGNDIGEEYLSEVTVNTPKVSIQLQQHNKNKKKKRMVVQDDKDEERNEDD